MSMKQTLVALAAGITTWALGAQAQCPERW